MDKIKKDVIDFFNDKTSICDDLFDSLAYTIFGNNIIANKIPIYYLFDHTIDKFGYSFNKLKQVFDKLYINDLFRLSGTMSCLEMSGHGTILYNFEMNNRKYIYYSNTGKGINKQITYVKDKITSCKILFFPEEYENIWIKVSNDIIEIINIITNNLSIYKTDKFNIVEEYNKIKKENVISLTMNRYKELLEYSSKERFYEQYLVYILLDDIRKKYKNVSECIVNHIIDNKNDYFATFIQEINDKLIEASKYSSTLKYKLDNSFKLIYNVNDGLFNNIQQSDSCSFYSYYNLLINMKILYEFNNGEKAQNVVNCIIRFHYYMIYLYCLSNDTLYTCTNDKNYISDRYVCNNLYIYKLIYENDLLEDITSFYKNKTLIFLNNDNILNYKIRGELSPKINNTFARINNIFASISFSLNTLNLFYIEVLSNIRKKNRINITNFLYEINLIFKKIDKSLEGYFGEYFIEYWNALKQLYISYPILLIDSISNSNIYKNYEKRKIICIGRPRERNKDTYKIEYSYKMYQNQYLYNYDRINVIQLLSITELRYISNILCHLEENNINIIEYFMNKYNVKLDKELLYVRDISDTINIHRQDEYNIKNMKIEVLNNLYEHTDTNLDIDFKIISDDFFTYNKQNNKDYIYNLFKLYIKYNLFMKSNIYSQYHDKIKYSINNIQYNILKYVNKTPSDLLLGKDLTEIMLILSNSKYFICDIFYSIGIDYLDLIFMYPINEDTIILNAEFIHKKKEIIDILNDNKEHRFERIVELIGNNITETKIIKDMGIDNEKYISINSSFSTLNILLFRFGISFFDITEYIILFDKNNIINNKIIENKNGKIYVIIKKFNKYIEINYDNNNVIDKNNCYLFDKKKHKIIFDMSVYIYPFISLLPINAPILCYEHNNTYNVEIIMSSSGKSRMYGVPLEIMYKKEKVNLMKFDMLHFQIAPSNIFPLINTLDIYKYQNILYYYEMIYLSIDINMFKNTYVTEISSSIDTKINEILYLLRINEDPKVNNYVSQLKNFFKDNNFTRDNDYSSSIDSFISENRLCETSKIDISKNINSYISYFEDIIKYVYIDYHKNYSRFIYINLDKFIFIMECNVVINLLKNINDDTSCWDYQYVLNSLNSILYTNKKLKEKFFNGYEILFLLQNNYFFKSSQLTKYKEIKNDMLTKNPVLKLHQLMMGKGKTSVITPLLVFSLIFNTDIVPNIITSEHLIEMTKSYIYFTNFLVKKDVYIVSDFIAKKIWLENTDIELKKNNKIDLSKEYNIIDEFDSHYNYLQSMFNYIRKETSIDENIIDYIFYFVLNKNNKKVNISYNVDILNSNLEKYFEISNTMIYNQNYGFLENEKHRICIPYIRKDTPVKNSKFSNILLSLILTFKTYITEFNGKLTEYDYINIRNNPEILKELIPKLNVPDSIDIKYIKNMIDSILDKQQLLLNYLKIVNSDIIKYTVEQNNVSFQDIIYNRYNIWQTGYTGTVNIKLNKYNDKDKYVFREIIEDKDELIEVKLALTGYSCPYNYDNKVLTLNKNDTVENNLYNIINFIKFNDKQISFRGMVDISGLFVKYTNEHIASILHKKLNKKIVYFKKDEGIQYDTDIKYTPFDENNFYYYDQCHIVGSDLKQHRIGHIAVIIDETTRWTDFAQGIFRFRQLNRGTFLSVVYVNNFTDKSNILNNDDVYNLLKNNEKKFNLGQEYGIKYQFLKTLVRNKTNNYLETDLKPEFMRDKLFDRNSLIQYMNNNIYNIDKHKNNDILKIYNDIIQLNDTELFPLIIGTGLEQNLQQDLQQDSQQEFNDIFREKYHKLKHLFMLPRCILHKKCNQCYEINCVKMFMTDDYKINGKNIYISYNLLVCITDKYTCKTIHSKYKYKSKLNNCFNNRICYIEFEDRIVIEKETIGLDYYLYKYPVYNENGSLLFPYIDKTDKLNIDVNFVKMLGLKYYSYNDETIIDLQNCVKNINEDAFIILTYYLCIENEHYKISKYLLERIYNMNKYNISIKEVKKHTGENIFDKCYNMYDKKYNTYENMVYCYIYNNKNLSKYKDFKEKYIENKKNYLKIIKNFVKDLF
jgi:hypothetical protein